LNKFLNIFLTGLFLVNVVSFISDSQHLDKLLHLLLTHFLQGNKLQNICTSNSV